jgi:ribosomal protein S12 methylthiotransferase accessory factor
MKIFDQDHHQPKCFLPGTRRSRSPADTLRDYRRFFPEVGITRLADLTGLDYVGIPVIQAVRPNSRSLSVSQGKGVDVEAAKVSAMMESIELWHAERIHAPLRAESFDALRRTSRVVDVRRLPRSNGAEVEGDLQRTWIEGFDLLGREPTWVPFEFVNMNAVGQGQRSETFSSSSNGLASGNHLLEAIEHAMCEVIERDCHALFMARGTQAANGTKLALDTIRAPEIEPLFEALRRAELDVAVFDMTSDVGIPAYACAVVDREDRNAWRRLGVCWGYGCHVAPVVALARAITEAAQARITIIAGARDDAPPHHYALIQDPASLARAREAVFATAPARAYDAGAGNETECFEGDIEVMLAALRRVGIEQVVVVDLRKPSIAIPVVKVIIVGLEGPAASPDYTKGERARRVSAVMS